MFKKNLLIFGGSKGIGGVFTKRMLERSSYNIYLFARSNPYCLNADFTSVDFCQKNLLRDVLNAKKQVMQSVRHLVFFLKYRGGAKDAWEGEIAVELETIRNVLEIVDDVLDEGASIIFVSSVCAHLVTKNQPLPYHMAKAAIEQMARFYAVHLGHRNIRVNVVAPSLTLKPENSSFYAEQVALTQLYSKICPLQRMGKSEDVCEVIEFLLDVQFMTGQILRVDGGVSLQEYEGLSRELVESYLKRDLQIDIQTQNIKNGNNGRGGGLLIFNCFPKSA